MLLHTLPEVCFKMAITKLGKKNFILRNLILGPMGLRDLTNRKRMGIIIMDPSLNVKPGLLATLPFEVSRVSLYRRPKPDALGPLSVKLSWGSEHFFTLIKWPSTRSGHSVRAGGSRRRQRPPHPHREVVQEARRGWAALHKVLRPLVRSLPGNLCSNYPLVFTQD